MSRSATARALVISFALLLGGCGEDSSPRPDAAVASGSERAGGSSASAPADDVSAPVAAPVGGTSDASPAPGGSSDPAPSAVDGPALPPLPNPPLTPPPDANDEPLPLAETLHTAVGFDVFVNRPRPPGPPPGTPTEAEFAAGLPEPVLQAPEGLDLTENRPPYFPELDNVTVRAGEVMRLHLAPIDPDGGVAGQYTEGLPRAAEYIDNFDTTRTVVWRPLEPDVGIHRLTAYTVDPAEPALRVRYTVLVKVVMPSDPSTIVNLPPHVHRVLPQIARTGDPVAMWIWGTDPNGTVPTLEVTGVPPDATVVPHPEDERVRVLRFVPETAGEMVIDVLARDAREPTLTHRRTIELAVYPPEHFARDGARLRELAETRDFLVGFATRTRFAGRADGALYASTAAEEFNLVSPENAMKWDTLNPEPGLYRWAAGDNLVAYARAKDMLILGQTLVWYAQLPYWVTRTPLEEREGHMREFIDRVLKRYADDVPVWDVVNEALDENGGLRDSVWLEAMGADYIDIAFRQARASAPDATLLYNDYDIGFAGPKADGLFRLLERFEAAETPLDAVGFQMHVDADYDHFDDLAEHFARVAERDLDVYVTELDVSIREGQTEEDQARVFAGVLSVCLAEPRCRALQSWGFTDRHSWRSQHDPLMFDRDYAPKPAYHALQRRLGEN